MRRRTTLALICAAATLVLAAAAAAFTPSDPLAAHPAYAALNLPAAWDITTGSPKVAIAIVDSGVDPAHAELQGRVDEGYDFVANRSGATPVDGHGTGVASVAAARATNGLGGVGACFECRILPAQVVGPGGIALNTDIRNGIDFAVDHGAAVVNISLIGPNSPPELEAAVARARAAGVLVVAAAGNEGAESPRFPAATPGVISVGASTYDGRRAGFSNYGEWVKFAAPECAPIAVLGAGSGAGCGTSMSSPLVAGIVALMRTQAPFATPEAIEASLVRSSRTVSGIRYGVPDAAAALRDLGSPAPIIRATLFGQAAVGHQLEAFSGLWMGSGTEISYRWERCSSEACVVIDGATGSRYVPTTSDVGHRVRVILAAAIGTTTSAPTAAVEDKPRVAARPSIKGLPRVGARLVANPGRWTGDDVTFTLTWRRCRTRCEDAGAGRTYRVQPRDRGARFRIRVQASNRVGTSLAVSDLTGRARS
jgi:hypothetical protein